MSFKINITKPISHLQAGIGQSALRSLREGLHQSRMWFARINPLLKLTALMALIFVADSALAADWDIPGVSAIDGLGDADDPGSMILVIGKWILKVVLWVAALGTGYIVVKNVVKAINKVHRDEDGRWSAVIGEIIGNIATFLFVLGLAAWLTAQFS